MDLKQCRVLVTPTSYGRNDPRLKIELEEQVGEVIYNPSARPLTSDEVAQLLPDVDGFIAGLDIIDASALKAADKLKVISRYGVGYENVDLDAARNKGIVVTNTPGANAVSVAELALGLIITLARQIPNAAKEVHKGKWTRFPGFSLEGKTIGIIGLGAIGKQLAYRLKNFNCRILACDPHPDKAYAKEHHIEFTTQAELLKLSDFVSLHLPVFTETYEMVDSDFLGQMKKGSFLINTARGGLINEESLLQALRSGHIRGAALDALKEEPPAITNPLLDLPQVIVTPHIGAQTDSARNNMGWMSLKGCLAVLKNEEPEYRVV